MAPETDAVHRTRFGVRDTVRTVYLMLLIQCTSRLLYGMRIQQKIIFVNHTNSHQIHRDLLGIFETLSMC